MRRHLPIAMLLAWAAVPLIVWLAPPLGSWFVVRGHAERLSPTPVPTPTPTPTSAPVQITVATNPTGLRFSADDTEYVSPQTFAWLVGSSHSLSTSSPQNGATGTRYLWENWSDGGAQTHSVTTPPAATTYLGDFSTQYFLTMCCNGSFSSVMPNSGYYDAGQLVMIRGWGRGGQSCCFWQGSGNGSYTGTNNPATILMNGPIQEYGITEGPTPTPTASASPTPTPCCQLTASVGTQCDFRFNTAGSLYGIYYGALVRSSCPSPRPVIAVFYLEASSDGTAFVTILQSPPQFYPLNPGQNTLSNLFDNVAFPHQYSFYRVRMQIDACDTPPYYSLVTPVCRPAVSPTPSPAPSPGCPQSVTRRFYNPIPIEPADRGSNEPGSDPGLPFLYPSMLQSVGRPDGERPETSFGRLTGVSFTVNSERPDDLDLLLGVVADGLPERSTLLISDAGGDAGISNRSYTVVSFDNFTAPPFPDGTAPAAGTYRAADYLGLAVTEPSGVDNFPGVSGLTHYPLQQFSSLTSGNPNANWRLYVVDDEAGNRSSLPNGWSMETVTTYTQGGGCIVIPTPTPSPSSSPSPTPSPTPCVVGGLDPFFNGTGKVTTNVGGGDDYVTSIAIQPDGKIVAAGHAWMANVTDLALARYNTNGTLDPSFGNGGKLTTSIGPSSDFTGSVLLQPDGRIVVVGGSVAGDDYDFAVVRYNSDGTLDTSFGNGGIVTTPVGNFDEIAYSGLLQLDGKIVAAGASWNGSSEDFAVVRYDPDGSLDTTFGTGGKVRTSLGPGNDINYAVALQPDGKIVTAGESLAGSAYDFALVRYNRDGTLDNTFGTGGKVTTPVGTSDDEALAVTVQPDGKIVAVGASRQSNWDLTIVRYDTAGQLDTAFGIGGKVVTQAANGDDYGTSTTIQPDGKIVVAGYGSNGSDNDWKVVRYEPNGILDTSFAMGGIATTSIAGEDRASSCALAADGKIVVGGSTRTGGAFSSDFALARYFAGGPCVTPSPSPTMTPFTPTPSPTPTVSPTPSPVAFDFDGDRIADLAVYRPSNGTWYLNRSRDGLAGVEFGVSTDMITPADFDRDGRTDVAVFRQSNYTWYRLNSSTAGLVAVTFSVFPGPQLPTVADYDGDRRADISEYTAADGYWNRLNSSNNSPVSIHFGISEDKPTVGDFDGDGRADLSVFRPSAGVWYRLNSSNGAFSATAFGLSDDRAVPADYDGDGQADIAVYRPSEGTWYVLGSSQGFFGVQFGLPADIPVPADYDGDGKADIAVFRPSSGVWYRLNSSNGAFVAIQWGLAGDKPIPSAFIY